MKLSKRIFAALVALLCVAAAMAADTTARPVRPVIAAFTAGAGSRHICDTYLTPLHYRGTSWALGYERMQAMRANPQRLVMQLAVDLDWGKTHNPAKSATMWDVAVRPSWAMMWRRQMPGGLTLAAGPRISATLGADYLGHNSNNPVAAKAALTIGISGMGVWNGRLGRLPVTLHYQPSLALAGAFFAPEYDELYYEIWLGNRRGLCHGAWPGNYFDLRNRLCADLHLGATTLRVGYRADVLSSKAGGIVNRSICHMLVLGVAVERLSLRPGSRHTNLQNIISALY